MTELNEILWNSMANSWSKQVYVQGFECESITFKISDNILNVWKFWSLFTKA